MKKFLIISVVVIVFAVIGGAVNRNSKVTTTAHLTEKLYVAVEGKGVIAVVDPLTRKVMKEIDLSSTHDGEVLMYMPHNIQVSPDMKTVWVTANAVIPGQVHSHTFLGVNKAFAHGDNVTFDEVIIIDSATDKIAGRISLAPGAHLAHVSLSPDSKFAYVTAQIEGAIYKLNAQTYAVEKRIPVAQGSEPHGLRVSTDGRTAYVAVLKGKALGMLDLATDAFTATPLKGSAVQTGVTPNGKLVVASIYDTKSLALYHTDYKWTQYIDLPAEAKGPVQMYSTPDSAYIYLADQGYYFKQPENNVVYKIDVRPYSLNAEINSAEPMKAIKAGRAPHGVVISPDGKYVYVTNLLSNDVSVIDTSTDVEVARIPIGKEPNGISYWKK